MEERMNDSARTIGHPGRTYLVPGLLVLALLTTMACGSNTHLFVAHDMPDVAHAAHDDGTSMPVSTASQTDSVTPMMEAQLVIENFQFNPPVLTVPVGTTVTWVNHDRDEHTVTSSTRLFSSAGLDPNETYSYRFDTAGTYAYFCALHPHMTAQIVVQ
jgi:plastocyanin